MLASTGPVTRDFDDVRRFQGFVDYLVSTPLEQGFADFNLTQEEFNFRLAHNKKVVNRLWLHVVPQLWLIQRFVEAPIVFVGRLESYRADLDELQLSRTSAEKKKLKSDLASPSSRNSLISGR